MKLSSIKSLPELRKFVKENRFLYDVNGKKVVSETLSFVVTLDMNHYVAIYQSGEESFVELFDKKSYKAFLEEEEKNEIITAALSEYFSQDFSEDEELEEEK